ncbi:MAG: Cell division inhibitor [Fibrobacteres bacterium]|nr:Cell division inhibitor [Fibrobacterota bacterium]
MIVLMTGATGFIGRTLSARLSAEGHTLRILTRNTNATPAQSGLPIGTRAFPWTSGDTVPAAALDGADAVVHLAGESIGSWPWTAARKRRILESRVLGTRALVRAISEGGTKPSVLVAASAVGYYGDGGGESLPESHAPGKGFLAEVCVAWEREIFRARELGLRAVAVRNGLVLGRGGALAKLLPVYRKGGGAVLGSGRQWWSWVHVEDTAGIFLHALGNGALEGAVNGCAPEPVAQREFADTLAKAVRRPRLFRIPAFALRLGLGEMAATLLEGQKTDVSKLSKGYDFRYRTLEAALENIVAGG